MVTRQDNPQPLMRRWGFRSAYPTVEAMLSAEELDALFVLTPRSEHAHATRLALEADVDVFCEKPLATSAADAQSLAQLATEHSRVLMVGFNRRFAPVYEAGHAAFSESGASFCIAQKNRAGSEYRATFEMRSTWWISFDGIAEVNLSTSARTLPVRTPGRKTA